MNAGADLWEKKLKRIARVELYRSGGVDEGVEVKTVFSGYRHIAGTAVADYEAGLVLIVAICQGKQVCLIPIWRSAASAPWCN